MSTRRSERPYETHRLVCILNSEELAIRKNELSSAVNTLRQCEEEKKRVAKQLGDKVEAAKQAVCDINNETETGKGVRDVVCTWSVEVGDGGERRWYLRRTDTREIIQTEPLSADDVQETLFS